jgi:DNA-binding NarL/FixJ family response regulator
VGAGIAYLRKSQLVDSQDLVDALEAVLSEKVGQSFRHDLNSGRPLARLSQTQLDVLQLVAEGCTNATVAERRGTTVRAVESMLARIFSTLGIETAGGDNPRIEAAKAYFSARGQVPSGGQAPGDGLTP